MNRQKPNMLTVLIRSGRHVKDKNGKPFRLRFRRINVTMEQAWKIIGFLWFESK